LDKTQKSSSLLVFSVAEEREKSTHHTHQQRLVHKRVLAGVKPFSSKIAATLLSNSLLDMAPGKFCLTSLSIASFSSGRPAITLATRSEADWVPARMFKLVEARPAGEAVKAEAEATRRARDARESFMVVVVVVWKVEASTKVDFLDESKESRQASASRHGDVSHLSIVKTFFLSDVFIFRYANLSRNL
jgi:hypothetical protein